MTDKPTIDTPRTDAAQQSSRIAHQGIPDDSWPWDAINEGWEFARELERENGAGEGLEIIKGLLCSLPLPVCYDFHHAAKDRHDADQDCPCLDRFHKAKDAARAFLARFNR